MRAGLSPEGIRREALWEGGVSYDKRIARGSPGCTSKEALSSKARLSWPMRRSRRLIAAVASVVARRDRTEVVRSVRIKRDKCSEPHNNHQAVFGMPPRKRSRPTANSLRRACTMPTSNSAGFMRASTCSLRHSPSWDQLQKCSQLFLNKL